jgi:DNA repair protein RAD16
MMVAAAIELSRETARLAAQEHLGVGSSSRTIASPNPKITKRAAAAERRLTKTGSKTKGKGKGKARASPSSDDDFILAESESELSALTSSEDEAQPSNGKGKTAKKDKAKYIATEPMTWVERAERRREQAAARRLTRQEEMALRQELGRRLTWVSNLSLLEHHSNGQHRPRKPLWH